MAAATCISSANILQVDVLVVPTTIDVKLLQPTIMESKASTASKSSPSTADNFSPNDESTATLPSGDSIKDKCKDRLDNFKKQMKKTMPLSDQLDMRDPQSIAEFA